MTTIMSSAAQALDVSDYRRIALDRNLRSLRPIQIDCEMYREYNQFLYQGGITEMFFFNKKMLNSCVSSERHFFCL